MKQYYWKLLEVARRLISKALNQAKKLDRIARSSIHNGMHFGKCPVCGKRTLFLAHDNWLREYYFCLRCGSNSRTRALIYTLESEFPQYREMHIYESSPGGSASDKLRRECPKYEYSHFYPDVPLGTYINGTRCENLEKLTFPDNVFDIVVTQDVMEHVFSAENAFSEIARVLKPGGAHIFTVPWHRNSPTVVRAHINNGKIIHVLEPVYHGNPIDSKGALAVRDWGGDLPDFIERHSGLKTTIHDIHDNQLGLRGECLEVLVSRKT